MSDVRDALLFLDLDKGGQSAGPLFDEPRRRLDQDPALRAGWNQYQALKALAWEAAPEPGDRLVRQALAACRRERVRKQLARSAGSEDLARQILLGRIKERRGLPAWLVLVLLAGALALGWAAFGPQLRDWWSSPLPLGEERPLPGGALPAADQPVPFEFPAETPVSAALDAPADEAADSSDVKHEVPAARQARRLLREHLQARREAAVETAAEDDAERQPGPAPTHAPPARALPPPAATRVPTAVPTAAPTPVPTAAPTAVPIPVADAAAEPVQAGMSLSNPSVAPGKRLQVSLDLPERRDIDLRLFDQRGRPVRVLLEGTAGPGSLKVPLDAVDAAAKPLAPGTYYLRVMTPWFSRVEPVEVEKE